MSIRESGDKYYPSGEDNKNAASVFYDLNESFSSIGNTPDAILRLEDDDVEGIASNYAMTSIGYFANHSDDYLKSVGTAMIKAFNDRRLELVCERKPSETNRFGIEVSQGTGKITLLIPSEFIVLARRKPVLALASILGSFSRIVDLLDGKSATDDLMIKKAEATQAHFLIRTKEEGEPSSAEIKFDFQSSRVLAKYPKGIYSLANGH